MNREIKFRAWDKQGKEMFNVIMLQIPTEGKKMIASGRGGSAHIDKDTILMQYTGLKDKNGKEVFEGDVVKVEYRGEQIKGEVVFDVGRFCVKAPEDLESVHFISFGNPPYPEGIEVIGNIYENPELINPTRE